MQWRQVGAEAGRRSWPASAPQHGSVYAALTGNLSVNPLSGHHERNRPLDDSVSSVSTLAMTPLRRLTGWNDVIRFRRMLGLFAFFYGSLHFLTYVIADRFAGLDFPDGIVSGPRCGTSWRRWARTSTSGRSSPSASPRSSAWCRWP